MVVWLATTGPALTALKVKTLLEDLFTNRTETPGEVVEGVCAVVCLFPSRTSSRDVRTVAGCVGSFETGTSAKSTKCVTPDCVDGGVSNVTLLGRVG